MSRTGTQLLSVPALACIAACVFGPCLLMLRVSLYAPAAGRGFYTPDTLTFANYAAFVDPHILGFVAMTIVFGVVVALLVVAIGYPLSLYLSSLPARWQPVALALLLVPKTAGLLAMLFGLQRWLPRGLLAAIIAEVYLVLPYSVLVLHVQLRAVDLQLLDAARGLGASAWQVFRRVTLPLSWPGLLLAFQFGLMWGLGAFLGPLFLGGPRETTLAVELHRQAFEYGRWPLAATEAVGLMTLVGLAAWVVSATGSRPRGAWR